MTPSEICDGYEIALDKVLSILPSLALEEIKDYRDEKQVYNAIRTAIMSKQLGNEDLVAKLVTKACSEFELDYYSITIQFNTI